MIMIMRRMIIIIIMAMFMINLNTVARTTSMLKHGGGDNDNDKCDNVDVTIPADVVDVRSTKSARVVMILSKRQDRFEFWRGKVQYRAIIGWLDRLIPLIHWSLG